MRIAALLVALVVYPVSQLCAGPLVFLEFLNSDLTFGTGISDQAGHDLSSFTVDAITANFDFSADYQATAGGLIQQTTKVNGAGEVIGSEYVYGGGTFEIVFGLEKNGASIQGAFVAPITTLTIWAGEGDGESAWASYVLGEGLFDQSIAGALGIGRHTGAGEVFSGLLLTDHGNRSGVAGDHTTPERQAWDGYADVTLQVPEPAIAPLVAIGTGFWARRRSRRQA